MERIAVVAARSSVSEWRPWAVACQPSSADGTVRGRPPRRRAVLWLGLVALRTGTYRHMTSAAQISGRRRVAPRGLQVDSAVSTRDQLSWTERSALGGTTRRTP